ncbi:MAG: polyprenyl diphosphate synthase [Pseudomonadota bacterium]
MPTPTPTPLPQHIAIIMDGNGRWAKQRNKPRTFGHQAGLKATRKTVENCVEFGIGSLTLFAFSSENWRRPETEVGMLMDLFFRALKNEVNDLDANGVRISFVGDTSAFSDKLQQQMRAAEEQTDSNSQLNLNIAVNYGGRWDLVNGVRSVAQRVADGALDPESITEDVVSGALELSHLPEPDLMIRTSGEQRLSNYLLWQMAYTELYFTDVLWPDFDKNALLAALDWFAGCERRYGKTGEQLLQATDHA